LSCQMGKVSLVKTTDGIKQGLYNAIEFIGGMGQYAGCNDKVMLKPNLNGLEGFTNKDLVEALLQLLSDFNVKKVVIAESTYGDERVTDMFFNTTGYRELARKYNIDLINFNRSKSIEIQVKNPLVLKTLRIAREVFEADKIINLPNMKVHYATGITLALKNMKGVLVGDEKRHFHEIGLDKAIVDLNNTVRPHLNIVDAIQCMERMGPRGGDVVDLGLIMAGASAWEVDWVGASIMGYAASEVKHLARYMEVNRTDPGGIEVVGEKPEAVRRPFKKVTMDNIVPKKIRVHDRNACSSCMNAFLLSCQLLESDPLKIYDVYIGDFKKSDADEGGIQIAFGNCSSRNGAFNETIRGCPPYPFALNECVSESLRIGLKSS
jgi:uncharacterized protein (DUF362 family)